MAQISNEEFDKRYPQHAKADDVKDARQAIGEFIETGGYTLCKWPEDSLHPQPTHQSINEVLAGYYEIDLKALEQEKQAMLKALSEAQS
jgi:hypothetical protein